MAARYIIECELLTEGGDVKPFYSVPLGHDEQWREVEKLRGLGYKVTMVHEREASSNTWADIERRMRMGEKVDIFAETALAAGKREKVKP